MKLKHLLFSLLVSSTAMGQIFFKSATNGSITISPDGLKGSSNSQNNNKNLALGDSALRINTTGTYNTAIGGSAMHNNTQGWENTVIGNSAMKNNTLGNLNTAVGAYSLQKNAWGTGNTAVGYAALASNVNANGNTALGNYALFKNDGSNNTVIGYQASYNSLGGGSNTVVGHKSMFNSTYASNNVAIGYVSLYNASYSAYNTAVGDSALFNTAGGSFNTAIGGRSGDGIVVGQYNTFAGYNARATGDFMNATAIGANAVVDASAKIRIGDANVTVIEGAVPWTVPSDRRLKENIVQTDNLGLNFISRLQPVAYNYMADKSKTQHDGFIAQDVEKVMQDLKIQFSGLRKSPNGTYSLAYSDFVMPLVNAVKELKQKNDDLVQQNARLEKQNQLMAAKLLEIEEIKAELVRMKTIATQTSAK